jgi:hypothetical protein
MEGDIGVDGMSIREGGAKISFIVVEGVVEQQPAVVRNRSSGKPVVGDHYVAAMDVFTHVLYSTTSAPARQLGFL